MISVTAVTPPDFTYTVYQSTGNSWNFSPFIVSASQSVLNLCGGSSPLTYTVTGESAIDSSLSHTHPSYQITIYSEDLALVTNSPYTYTVSAELTNFPGYGTAQDSGTITLTNSCANPFSLSVAASHVSETSDYSAQVTLDYPAVTVEPSICLSDAVFECTLISSPYSGVADLCAAFLVNNGNYVT